MKIPAIRNRTHHARAIKVKLDETITQLSEKAQKKQEAFNDRLHADESLTHVDRAKMLGKSGEQLTQTLINSVQKQAEPLQLMVKGYDERISEMKEIRGTTDVLILSSTATSLLAAGMSTTQIYSIARQEIDVARAVLLAPALKYGLEMSDAMKQSFHTEIDKHVLGSEYSDYENASKRLELLDDMGQHFLGSHSEYLEMQRQPEAVVHEMPSVEESAVH